MQRLLGALRRRNTQQVSTRLSSNELMPACMRVSLETLSPVHGAWRGAWRMAHVLLCVFAQCVQHTHGALCLQAVAMANALRQAASDLAYLERWFEDLVQAKVGMAPCSVWVLCWYLPDPHTCPCLLQPMWCVFCAAGAAQSPYRSPHPHSGYGCVCSLHLHATYTPPCTEPGPERPLLCSPH